MNDHDLCRALLDDFVDGELSGAERDGLERHLAECEECRMEVAAIRDVGERARALPRDVSPSRDLWREIEARLEPRGQPAGVIPLRPRRARSRNLGVWAAAAVAATVMVMLGSGATLLLLQQRGGVAPVASTPGGSTAPAATVPGLAFAAHETVEQEYLGTLEALEADFELRRGSLSPETQAVVDENLRVIDAAIAEIRAALEADGGSTELPLLLSGVYRAKVELLQSTIGLYART
jgi:hypothetical protein